MTQAFADLVIVVPGILGSRLARVEDDIETPVWDLSLGRLPAALRELSRDALVFTGDGRSAPTDDIKPVGLLSTAQWLPGFVGVDGYDRLVSSLRTRLGDTQVVEFPYDWRLSNVYTAERLQEVAERELDRWKEESGNRDAQLVLVCHSMGGLVARYFCEQLGGSDLVRTVVTIGTPHRGAIVALDAIVNGKKLARFVDVSDEVRSLPSVYELLPIYPSVHLVDRAGARMRIRIADRPECFANLRADRLTQAVEFHDGIRQPALARAAADEPSPYEQVVFFNRRQPTPHTATLAGGTLTLDGANLGPQDGTVYLGDGTVPWFSALPIEWDDDKEARPVHTKHPALQSTEVVIDTLTQWLEPASAAAYKAGEIGDGSVIQLAVPSVVEMGPMRAEASIEIEVRSPQAGQLLVELWSPDHIPGEDPLRHDETPNRGGTVVFDGLAEGAYAVRAMAKDRRQRPSLPYVEDWVLVLSDD